MVTPIKVAVIGHSYVKRLEEYSLKDQSRTNLGFPIEDIVVEIFGVSGGSVRRHRRQCICQVLDGACGVNKFEPHVVFVHLGENDVSRMESSELMKCYFDFCDQLASVNSVGVIVVSELLPFPVITQNAQHLQCLTECNEILNTLSRECVNVDKAYMWHHRIGASALDAATRIFHRDGVHMSKVEGMNQYYGSVRTAVAQGVRKLQLHSLVV